MIWTMSGSNTSTSVESQQYLQKEVLQGLYGPSCFNHIFQSCFNRSAAFCLTMNYISNHFVKDGFSIHLNSTWFTFWDKECDIFSFKTIPKDILWTRLSKIVVSVEAITSGPLGSQRFWVWFQAEVIVF